MDEKALRAEVDRLRELLDDNGIDWEPPLYGPPRAPIASSEIVRTTLQHLAKNAALRGLNNRLGDWQAVANFRIRTPTTYVVRTPTTYVVRTD